MDNRVALKEVAWQESTDNGDTWTTIEKSNTIRHNVGMQEPGKRQVRARMVNKNTLAESFTAPVEVWAYATLDAQITGPRHMAPGYTATLASELYREGVLTANTVNEWKIEAPSGITTATGATATITEEQEGKVYITLKTRPADTRADDANAWSIARYYLTVKPRPGPASAAKARAMSRPARSIITTALPGPPGAPCPACIRFNRNGNYRTAPPLPGIVSTGPPPPRIWSTKPR